MNKHKFGILINVFIFLISFFVQSAENKPIKGLIEMSDSIQIPFKKKITEANGDSLKLIEAHYEFGEYLNNESKLEASIEQFKIALRIAKNINDNAKVATVANYLANIYAGIGDFNASNNDYLIALEGAEKTNNSGEIAKISMNLASNYNYTGDYQKAIKYGLYALKTKETKETKNNLERICYHYIAMGNIFRENNNTVKWEEYVQKAYKMKSVESCASFSDIAKIYNSLGGIAVQKKEYERGLLYYDTLMTLSREANYNQGISTALTNSAGIYKQLDNFPKALEMDIEAEQYFGGNPYDKIFNKNFKAELYNLTEEFIKGLALVNNNIQTKEIDYYSTEKLKCLELLYELNFNLSNYDEAFFWNDSLRNTEQILRDEDIRQSIAELETKYETEKKEQQIELLQTENKFRQQEKIAFIASLIALLLLIVAGVLFYFKKKRDNQVHSLQLRQQLLRSQMNPHFLFNALGSIQNFMYKNETKKAAGYLGNFASLTRSILEHSAEEFVSLFDEIEMLRNYIELEKMRLAGKFDYEIELDENIETEFVNVPPMLLQPFVENAIKHGLKETKSGGLLFLKFTETENTIYVEIRDNGLGINNASKSKGSTHRSMSMQIFDERRKVLSKRTNQKIECAITDLSDEKPAGCGTKVEVRIPLV